MLKLHHFKAATEVHFFAITGIIGIIVGIILLIVKRPILKLMGDVR